MGTMGFAFLYPNLMGQNESNFDSKKSFVG